MREILTEIWNKIKQVELLDLLLFLFLMVPSLRLTAAFQKAESPILLFGQELDISFITGPAFGIGYGLISYMAYQAAGKRSRMRLKADRKLWWLPLVTAIPQVIVGLFIMTLPMVERRLGRDITELLPGTTGQIIAALWVAISNLAIDLALVTAALTRVLQPPKDGSTQKVTIKKAKEPKVATITEGVIPVGDEWKAICGCGWNSTLKRTEGYARSALLTHQRFKHTVIEENGDF